MRGALAFALLDCIPSLSLLLLACVFSFACIYDDTLKASVKRLVLVFLYHSEGNVEKNVIIDSV